MLSSPLCHIGPITSLQQAKAISTKAYLTLDRRHPVG